MYHFTNEDVLCRINISEIHRTKRALNWPSFEGNKKKYSKTMNKSAKQPDQLGGGTIAKFLGPTGFKVVSTSKGRDPDIVDAHLKEVRAKRAVPTNVLLGIRKSLTRSLSSFPS